MMNIATQFNMTPIVTTTQVHTPFTQKLTDSTSEYPIFHIICFQIVKIKKNDFQVILYLYGRFG